MKTSGKIPTIDQIGRIRIPRQVCEEAGVSRGDYLEISVQENMLVLSKYKESCVFCGSTKNVLQYMGRRICKKCVEDSSRNSEETLSSFSVFENNISCVRRLLENRHFVIPKELCIPLNILDGDEFNIFSKGGKIYLKKLSRGCIFCGSMENLSLFRGKKICAACVKECENL